MAVADHLPDVVQVFGEGVGAAGQSAQVSRSAQVIVPEHGPIIGRARDRGTPEDLSKLINRRSVSR